MRTLRDALAGVLASLALLAGSGVGHATVDAPAVTDEYLFRTALAEFTAIRAQAPYADQLDWSSDGCSWSPDNPFGFKFLPACHRHDFGYRNYKRQGRFDESTRLAIDNNFKADLYFQCAGNWACNRTADLYYAAVREFGASATQAQVEQVLDRMARGV
ncbi:phospholipase [Saccharothrix syringae]|uniref:Phospholipase n=1 Tax=Saccharothrix syringae TaxID=103733 RepID=A0A5Q0H9J4_SACSY|nr:phospholipase [Saccharothrix syringae]QFZ22613.1 phospholipase [Saccharothrix syringae]